MPMIYTDQLKDNKFVVASGVAAVSFLVLAGNLVSLRQYGEKGSDTSRWILQPIFIRIWPYREVTQMEELI